MYDRASNVIDRREFLRIKAKSLAAEARIIRHEANKSRGYLKHQMNHHRKTVVRQEARVTHLALGYIKGRRWSQMEADPKTRPNFEKVLVMISKYGPCDKSQREALLAQVEKEARDRWLALLANHRLPTVNTAGSENPTNADARSAA